MALVECAGCHDDHRDVDRARHGKREHHLDVGKPQHGAAVGVVSDNGARLHQARVQVDRMRHDRGPDDAHGDGQRGGVRQNRLHHSQTGGSPVHGRDQKLGQIAQPDHANHRPDDQLHRAKSPRLEDQDCIGHDGGDHHACKERQAEQQRQPDGTAQKLGQIGGHGGNFADGPHDPDHGSGKVVPRQFRQIAPRDDPQPCRQRLKQHGDKVRQDHDPQQFVAITGTGLNVGRIVAGVHVGDRCDDRGACKQQLAAPAGALSAQDRCDTAAGFVSQGGHGFIQLAPV